MGLDGLQPGAGVELREDHHLPPAPDGREHRGGAGDVIEGDRDEKHVDVFGAGVGRLDGVRHVDRHSEMGEDHALRQRRCAARVDDDRRVAVLDVREDFFRLVLGDQVFEVRHALRHGVDANGMGNRGEVRLDLVRQLEVALAGEQQLRLRVVAHVGELFLLGPIVQGNEDGAQLRHGIVDLNVLHRVEGHYRYLVALTDVHRLEPVGEAVHPLLHLRIGPRALPADHRRPLWDDGRGDHQEFSGIHGRASGRARDW